MASFVTTQEVSGQDWMEHGQCSSSILRHCTELRGHCQTLTYTQPEDFKVNLLYGKGESARPLSMNCFTPMGTLAQMNKKPRPPAVGVLLGSMPNRSPQTHKSMCAWRGSWEGWKEENQWEIGLQRRREPASHPPTVGYLSQLLFMWPWAHCSTSINLSSHNGKMWTIILPRG